ncbi:hypothetical protein BCR33DRAFT_369891 [Rhizoclosmatium globosum]|uniref:Uncharacterized protein n=1 Tax=Rhizoclosmatium globosum TaxID=329046 RepID=A0A1Y2BZA2_9FUNG|nr:hypothetical protein BCR33DRAFT_369891 [Rhizoclosmatium globosum]|eukprot:ORY40113.1 hypothetical protein BCR33DRAFT_369891 [Rhizoclosmatium globosum]
MSNDDLYSDTIDSESDTTNDDREQVTQKDLEERVGLLCLEVEVDICVGVGVDAAPLRLHVPKDLLKSGVELREYQVRIEGVEWMHKLWSKQVGGAILADEMGLGKTIQTISFLLLLHRSAPSSRFLVVTPLSLIENWADEFQKFAAPSSVNVVKYTGSKEERGLLREKIASKDLPFDVLLVTYENVSTDIDFIRSFDWTALIVDEAHRLKNPLSLLHTTLLTLLPPPFKLLLTGTPVQNNLNELESLLSFSCPRVFGESPPDGTLARLYGGSNKDSETTRNKALKDLNTLIRPFMLRREKETVLTLPPMKETILYTPMTDLQKKLYKSILTKDMSAFDTGKKTALMNVLMQLRKCCNHPYLFDGIEPEPFQPGNHLYESSGKLFLLDSLLSHLHKSKHRVLLFSQMTHMLDILQDYLAYRNYSAVRLDGSIRGQERHAAVTSFTDGDTGAFVFLLSTRAGGVGLNLTTADTVIFFDSDFNPMMDMQAAARAHRIGQTKPVSVIRLLSEGSVEEVIFKRARAKRSLSDAVVSTSTTSASSSITDALKSPTDIISMLRFGVSALADTADVSERVRVLVDGFIADSTQEVVSDAIQEDASITRMKEQITRKMKMRLSL